MVRTRPDNTLVTVVPGPNASTINIYNGIEKQFGTFSGRGREFKGVTGPSHTILPQEMHIKSVVLSHDGVLIAFLYRGNQFAVWSFESRTLVCSSHPPFHKAPQQRSPDQRIPYIAIRFGPDNRSVMLLSKHNDLSVFEIWKSSVARMAHVFELREQHKGDVLGFAISRNSGELATITGDGFVKVFGMDFSTDQPTLKLRYTVSGAEVDTISVEFAEDGTLLRATSEFEFNRMEVCKCQMVGG
ncbi:hypothetical protein P154DRAFT_532998 [Amniculicola lignicola CBS 123094]|uniref:WD40 repeat-like protein n=1 Tax=Amniculicola lignicola CBS 123094 TaxID=1392246 RepID=A0A6A5WTL0_9PLEO|nr:hypothetical protein P154DRAFT_532998 [Amniculicola lignicola CBS 123094]